MGSWLFYPAEDAQNMSLHERNEYDNEDNIYICDEQELEKTGNEHVNVTYEDEASIPIHNQTIINEMNFPPLNNNADVTSMSDNSTCNDTDTNKGYSASDASSGSGFHGETKTSIVNKSARDLAPLPLDAKEILISIENYLEDIKSDEGIIALLSDSDVRFINTVWNSKLKENLIDLIESETMSNTAYNTLKDIFTALQSKKYGIANKKITEITKNTKEWKINKKWITSFKSIVRLCKKHKI